MEIKIGVVGKIVAGEDAGGYVKIINDDASSGGLLILTASDAEMTHGFDNWVENKEMLRRYFEEAQWSIDWLQ